MLEQLRNQLNVIGVPKPHANDYPSVEPRLKPEFETLVRDITPRAILEMGSWEGRSAIAWLQACRKLDLTTELVCVDTWLGSAEHWLDEFPDGEWSRARLRVVRDSPRVYDTFCNTIWQYGMHDEVVALRTTNRVATDVLTKLGHQFQIIYVDGAHDFRSVLSDLLDSCSLVSADGVISGDDWGWNGVRQAVLLVAILKRFRVYESDGGSSYALKPKSSRLDLDTQHWRLVSRVAALRELLRLMTGRQARSSLTKLATQK